MIETFSLEYSPEQGIFAWADLALYDEFTGPKMKIGNCWEIQLGRRLVLDEEDPDGSIFIEGIIEAAVIFPSAIQEWGTVETSPGVWVTRMKRDQKQMDRDGTIQTKCADNQGYCAEDEDEDETPESDDEGACDGMDITFIDDDPVLLRLSYDITDFDIQKSEASDCEMQVDDMGWRITTAIPDVAYGAYLFVKSNRRLILEMT